MENDVQNPFGLQKKPSGKALGRGLAALLGEASSNEATEQIVEQAEKEGRLRTLLIDQISPNPEQPRQVFNQAKLEELSESIKEQGLIQPIIVRSVGDNSFQIIAGERRWRASRLAGLLEIPAIVVDKETTQEKNDIAALIENIQREDLNPIELARAYGKMLGQYQITQEQLAKKLGVSRVSLANTLRLLKLPESVKELLQSGRISEGHGRALLMLEKDDEISTLAQRILDENLSVRDVEARVRAGSINPPSASIQLTPAGSNSGVPSQEIAVKQSFQKNAHLLALEDELRQRFGTKIQIRGSERKGVIEIFFSGQDSFNRLIHELRET
ncbi:MAG: ParB/RepB/Spo0J family partition protein [Proteobacteria bacterium]|nr:ParB/RepB/Spo0J family partition protein [Pseudomonadota bacterium]